MEVLFILLVLFAIVTALGHGCWVFLAWVFRGFRPRAGHAGYEPTLTDDRAAASRYLLHLRTSGRIDIAVYSQVTSAMADDARGMAVVQAGVARVAEPAAAVGEPAVSALAGAVAPVEVRLHAPPAAVPVQRVIPRGPAPGDILPDRPVIPPPPPREPRRPFTEVLASFMAEKNIRWGELVGGLLILCCSTALVISLWSQIEAIPVLKFLIFTCVTAAMFGTGLFVHHRWKLPTTGFALLIVSCLLVPLNLLAFAAFSRSNANLGNGSLLIELPSVALFCWLTFLAGRIIMAPQPRLFAGGIVGLSSFSLAVRALSPLGDTRATILAAAAAALYGAIMAAALRRESRAAERFDDAHAQRILLFLGAQSFACLVPLGLLIYGSGQAVRTVALLSPLVCAIGVPALTVGVLITRRLAEAASGQVRTAATSVAILALGVMLVGLGLAWPVPARLLEVSLVASAALLILGRVVPCAGVHAAAAGGFSVAWAIASHLLRGDLGWSEPEPRAVITALLSAGTGQALVLPAVAAAVGAAWFERRQSRAAALACAGAALAIAGVSVILVTAFGFARPGDPYWAGWVCLADAATILFLALRLESAAATWAGCLVGQLATVQLLVYAGRDPWCTWPYALLFGATLAAVAVLGAGRLPGTRAVHDICRPHVTRFAVLVSFAAAAWMLATPAARSFGSLAAGCAWTAGLWALIAFAMAWPLVLAGAQLFLLAAIAAGLQHRLTRVWPLGEPWLWECQLLALSGTCLAFAGIRGLVRRREPGTESTSLLGRLHATARDLLNPRFIATDRWVGGLAVLAAAALAAWSICPPVAAEHHWTVPNWGAHAHASGILAWGILVVLAAVLMQHLREGYHRSSFILILGLAACGTAFAASRFAPIQAAATAWRWTLALAFVLLSAAWWGRSQLRPMLARWVTRPALEPLGPAAARAGLLGLFAIPAVMLTATWIHAAASGNVPLAPPPADLWYRISLLGPALLVLLGGVGYAASQQEPAFGLAATLLGCAVVTGCEMAVLAGQRMPIRPGFLGWLAQVNAIAVSGVALAVHAARSLVGGPRESCSYPVWPLNLARSVIALSLAGIIAAIWLSPRAAAIHATPVNLAWGVAAVALVELAMRIASGTPWRVLQGLRETLWLGFAVGILACLVGPLDPGNWLAYHAILASLVLAGAARIVLGQAHARQLLGSGWAETFDALAEDAAGTSQIAHDLACGGCGYNLRGLSREGQCPECGRPVGESVREAINRILPEWGRHAGTARLQAMNGVALFSLGAVLFAIRAVPQDPQRPWWSAAALAALAGVSLALGGWTRQRIIAFIAGIEACAAVTVWWLNGAWLTFPRPSLLPVAQLVDVNVIALLAAAFGWLLIERRLRSARPPEPLKGIPFHRIASALAVLAMLGAAGIALSRAVTGHPLEAPVAGWVAWAATVAMLVACRLDPAAIFWSGGLYLAGLAAIMRVGAQTGAAPMTLAGAISVAVAAYVLLASAIHRWWPTRGGTVHADGWLPRANAFMTMLAILLALFVSWTAGTFGLRLLVTGAPLLCAGAMLAAKGGLDPRRREMIPGGVILAGVLAVWAWSTPQTPSFLCQRAAGLLLVVAAATPLALAGSRLLRATSWGRGVGGSLAGWAAIAGIVLILVSGWEARQVIAGSRAVMGSWSIAAIIAALAVQSVCLVLVTIREDLDPLRLPPPRREFYVYAA
jgi:hypothetical protein